MIRFILIFCFYIVCLGIFSISVKYADGLKINLIGWPEAILDIIKEAKT